MSYPKLLENHKGTTIFDFDSDQYALRQRRAYYHINDYPILMHTHNFYELNIVCEGEGRHYIENKNYPAKKGDVFAFPPKIRHGYWTAEKSGMSIFHLLIDKKILTRYHYELNNFAGFHILFEIEPLIRQQADDAQVFLHLDDAYFDEFLLKMDELVRLERETFRGEDTLIALRSVCFLCDLSRLISSDARIDNVKPSSEEALCIVKTTEYMNANYNEKISVDELAQVALMSRGTFLHSFRKLLGTSPMQHLKSLRLRYAAEMLESSNESIAAVALACGFFDSSHFIRIFKEAMTVTPVEYRLSQSGKQKK